MHGLPREEQVYLFYNGCFSKNQWYLNVAANVSLLGREANQAFEIIEKLASNDCDTIDRHNVRRVA